MVTIQNPNCGDDLDGRVSARPEPGSVGESGSAPESHSEEVACIGCGCTDHNACENGCSWLSDDPPVCSECPGMLEVVAFIQRNGLVGTGILKVTTTTTHLRRFSRVIEVVP